MSAGITTSSFFPFFNKEQRTVFLLLLSYAYPKALELIPKVSAALFNKLFTNEESFSCAPNQAGKPCLRSCSRFTGEENGVTEGTPLPLKTQGFQTNSNFTVFRPPLLCSGGFIVLCGKALPAAVCPDRSAHMRQQAQLCFCRKTKNRWPR